MEKSDSFKSFERFLGTEDGKIGFVEQDGELWFVYREKVSIPTKHHSGSWYDIKAEGKIPKDIIAKGKNAVREYAELRVNKKVKEQKAEHDKWTKFEKNPNFPISVKFDEKILEGRIISCEDTELRVRLEKPQEYAGEQYVIYGMASAMAGHHRFKKLGEFTDDAIETAKGLLIRIYETKKHELENKEIIDLAKKLNKEQK